MILSDIRGAISGRTYFSVDWIQSELHGKRPGLHLATVNQSLWRMNKSGALCSAGRGWYSTIPKPFRIDEESTRPMIDQLKKRFPLLPLTVWSTAQIAPYAHHVLARFITFIHTEADSVPMVADGLRAEGHAAYANPGTRDARRYVDLTMGTVVIVRASVSREPHEGRAATIEKLLVDLFIEKDRLEMMEAKEYDRVLENVVLSARVNIARLLSYAGRRMVRPPIAALLASAGIT